MDGIEGAAASRFRCASVRVLHRIAMLAGCLAGCSNSSEPTPPPPPGGTGFRATIATPAINSPVYGAFADGVAIIACDVTLRSTGAGAPGATWREAVLRWYPAQDLRIPFDSAVLSARDVALSWGGADIRDGETQVSAWRFLATIPFTLALEYHYRVVGAAADSSVTTQATCQPSLPVNPALPTISTVTILPSGPTIEPGDSLDVSFRATAPAGLWQTIVSVSGACDTTVFLPGFLTQSTPYAVRVPLGPNCALGASLSVSIITLDAALQATATIPVLLSVVDHTPPILSVSYGGGSLAVSGDYFSGDTLQFEESASDNDQLTYFVWEVLPAGIRDSVLLSSIRVPPYVPVPVRASWGAAVQLRFSALDRSGNRSTVATINTDSLRLHPVVQRPIAWRSIGGDTRQVLPDTKRGVFYVLLGSPEQLLTFALADAALLRTMDLPSCWGGFDITASGDSLLFPCPPAEGIGVLDLTPSVPQWSIVSLTTLDSANGPWPGTVFAMAGGRTFVGLSGASATQFQLLQVDLATGAEVLRLDAGGAGGVGHLYERSPNHDLVLVGDDLGDVQVYHTVTDQFGPLTSIPNTGGKFGFSADGQVIAEGMVILDAGLQVVRSVRNLIGDGSSASFLTPDGQDLYYITNAGLIRTRVSDGEIVERTDLPFEVRDFRVSEDGQWVVFRGPEGSSSGQVGAMDLR